MDRSGLQRYEYRNKAGSLIIYPGYISRYEYLKVPYVAENALAHGISLTTVFLF